MTKPSTVRKIHGHDVQLFATRPDHIDPPNQELETLTASEPELDPLACLETCSSADLCRLLRVSPRALRRHIAAGRVPAPGFRLGRSPRWRLGELLAWMGKQTP